MGAPSPRWPRKPASEPCGRLRRPDSSNRLEHLFSRRPVPATGRNPAGGDSHLLQEHLARPRIRRPTPLREGPTPMYRRAARTPLFRALQRTLRIAHLADQPGSPPVDELLEMQRHRLTRRDFLKGSLAVAAAAGAASVPRVLLPPVVTAAPPKVVIVGAGIAGLNAAWHLRKAGIRAAIYEGSPRTGGRMFSRHNVMAQGLTTEFGGEFIDSDHEDMLGLVKEFGLPLIDTDQPSE